MAAAELRLASRVCTCPVRIWRADARTAFSSTDCAKKMRKTWTRPAIRARKGAAISANSTAVAPLLSPIKAPKRLRRLVPAAVSDWAMALPLLREAGGARRNLDEKVRQCRRNVATGCHVGEEARRGARLEILCDLSGRGSWAVVRVDPAHVPAVRNVLTGAEIDKLQILRVEDRDFNASVLDRRAHRRVQRLLASTVGGESCVGAS